MLASMDLTTPTGRAMAGLFSVFAEFEHEILRERIAEGYGAAMRQAHRRSRILMSTGHLSLWLLADIFSSAPDPNMWQARALCSARALEGRTCPS